MCNLVSPYTLRDVTSFLDTLGSTYQAKTLPRAHRQRTPLLIAALRVLAIVLGTVAARITVTATALRRAALQLAGFGAICWSVFSLAGFGWGLLAVGISLLIVDALSRGDSE